MHGYLITEITDNKAYVTVINPIFGHGSDYLQGFTDIIDNST